MQILKKVLHKVPLFEQLRIFSQFKLLIIRKYFVTLQPDYGLRDLKT